LEKGKNEGKKGENNKIAVFFFDIGKDFCGFEQIGGE
jgi:hypothetical protein